MKAYLAEMKDYFKGMALFFVIAVIVTAISRLTGFGEIPDQPRKEPSPEQYKEWSKEYDEQYGTNFEAGFETKGGGVQE